MHVVRDIGKADNDQLAAIRDGTTRLLDELEHFMGGDLIEALCLWRQAAQKMQDRRARESEPGDPAVPQLLRPKRAS
jgi:hypothetical protein